MDTQATIFDAIAAREAAERGIALASDNVYLDVAREIAREIGRRRRYVTADDVILGMIHNGYQGDELGNAAGSIFRGKEWRWDGFSVVKSERVASHGRLIRIWEFIGK